MTRPQPTANCAWCGEEFTPPASAKHKRFCSARHREQWHSARVAEAKRLLAAAEDLAGESAEGGEAPTLR